MIAPMELATIVARAVQEAGLRVAVDRKLDAWDVGDEVGHYVIVRPIDGGSADLVGDGVELAAGQLVEADLWQSIDTEDDARVRLLVATLDRRKLPGLSYAGRRQSMPRMGDPDDVRVVRHVLTLRYPTRSDAPE